MISNLRFIVEGCLQESSTFYINSPDKGHKYWLDHIKTDKTLELNKEHLVIILLNTRNAVIGHTVISTGTDSQCLALIRDILRPVLVGGGKNFILIHNHPSGDSDPSMADRQLTRDLNEAAQIMQLKLLDHIICTSKNYYSFKESGDI